MLQGTYGFILIILILHIQIDLKLNLQNYVPARVLPKLNAALQRLVNLAQIDLSSIVAHHSVAVKVGCVLDNHILH